MDSGQYSTLMDALKDIPDPRKRRGKRPVWLHLLIIVVAGLASSYQNARAIGHWARLQADELRRLLPDFQRIPSEATFLRTMRQIDGTVLDRLVTSYTATLPTAIDHTGCILIRQGEVLQGQALDGKTVRGAVPMGIRHTSSAWSSMAAPSRWRRRKWPPSATRSAQHRCWWGDINGGSSGSGRQAQRDQRRTPAAA